MMVDVAIPCGPIELDRRVLLVRPTRRDDDVTERVLDDAGLPVFVCATIDLLCNEIRRGASAAVLTDDVLDSSDLTGLCRELARQPEWSDLPFVVLARAGSPSIGVTRLQEAANVTLLDRTVATRTLVSTVESAVRARTKQYQIRDLLGSEREARIEADRANKAKDRFLAILSHELRTPLTPIVFAVASLKQELAAESSARGMLDSRLQRALDMISRNVSLETKLIDDLLDLNGLVQGKLQLQRADADVHQALRDTLTMIDNDVHAKKLTVRTVLDATLFCIVADAARIHQVLWNLAKNAVKFTPAGGTIVLRTWNEGTTLMLSCADDGIGLPSEVLPQIFEPFEQGGEEITRLYGGLGLGLAVSRSLVQAHGGSLRADSDGPGKGSTFTVSLPGAFSAEMRKTADEGDAPSPARARQLTILLVEDHADTAEALLETLTSRGHRVHVVHAVSAALRAAAADRYDLLISDIGLPDGSGLDLIRRIAPRPSLGAIAVSGFGRDEDITRSRAAGFSRHLTKPVDFAQLEHAISELADASG